MKKLEPKNIYIWGTGVKAKEINEMYAYELSNLDIVGYIDNNEKKWGTFFYGKEVFSPEVLNQEGEKYVLIANRYEEEIRKQIEILYNNNCNIIDEDIISRVQLFLRYEKNEDAEIKKVVDRLMNHPLEVFNYSFVEKYRECDLKICFDEEKQLFYTHYCGKKMYFSRALKTEKRVKEYYKSILLEQDEESPHLYLCDKDSVHQNAVVVDAGVAEGNFSLSIIDKVSKIYMFEPDKDWVEALQYTFEPYKDKVVIINKYLSNYVNDVTTTIDQEINETINFIKMDIEGEEYYALRGAESAIKKSDDFQCLICTYHQEFAYDAIACLLNQYGIVKETSKGYMWYPDYGFRAPVLRRGVIRGVKNNESEIIRDEN